MGNRHFDPIKKECSRCGLLCTPEAFKYHIRYEIKQCETKEFKNMLLQTEIERGGKDGLPTMCGRNEVDKGWGI